MQKMWLKIECKKAILYNIGDPVPTVRPHLGTGMSSFLSFCVNYLKNAVNVNFGVTYQFQQAGEFTNMESMKNKDEYISLVHFCTGHLAFSH